MHFDEALSTGANIDGKKWQLSSGQQNYVDQLIYKPRWKWEELEEV
jgi:hypothetical protein